MKSKKIIFTNADFSKVANGLFKLLQLYKDKLFNPDGIDLISKNSLNYQIRLNFERNFITNLIVRLQDCLPDSYSMFTDIVVLWDIDDVIGGNNSNAPLRDRFAEFEVRPALPLLFHRIKEAFPKVIFGALSSGTTGHVEKALFNPQLHANHVDIGSFFDRNFVFSVKEMYEKEGFNKTPKIILPEAREIFNEEIDLFKKKRYLKFKELHLVEQVKTLQIIELKRINPTIKFIPIDDCDYAEMLCGFTVKPHMTYYSMFRSVW